MSSSKYEGTTHLVIIVDVSVDIIRNFDWVGHISKGHSEMKKGHIEMEKGHFCSEAIMCMIMHVFVYSKYLERSIKPQCSILYNKARKIWT